MPKLLKSTMFLILFSFSCVFGTKAQINLKGSGRYDTRILYAQTKQLGQFFNRFNNEEDRFGNRYYPNDKKYRERNGRLQYLPLLFNNRAKIKQSVKNDFISYVTNTVSPYYIKFSDNKWFAEVNAEFVYKGKTVDLIMYMKVEKENLGTKWIIANVYFDKFNQLFFTQKVDDDNPAFLHPKSHELDFMNLRKIFRNNKNLEFYASADYIPDHLTLFFYEIKKGNLKFKTVKSMKYHFFQVNNWYFEVSEFNRKSQNSGWLISNLFRVSEPEKKRFLTQMLGKNQ